MNVLYVRLSHTLSRLNSILRLNFSSAAQCQCNWNLQYSNRERSIAYLARRSHFDLSLATAGGLVRSLHLVWFICDEESSECREIERNLYKGAAPDRRDTATQE